ncbi:MAG: ATP-binding protein [Nitrospirae bacterium]|nr:ATP-binding protein [Nitrospirota bacterium]
MQDKHPHPQRFIIKRGDDGEVKLTPETTEGPQYTVSIPLYIDANELALPYVQFPKNHFPAANWLYKLLVEESLFYQPDISKLQVASPPGLPTSLTSDGSNLPWLALELKTKEESRFSLWQDHVKTEFPQISQIQVKVREEDHHAYFVITYDGGYKITSSGLSQGTLRFMALTLVPYLDNLPSLIVIEEPENGIHPRAIETVLQSLSSVYDSQVIISSHSPVVLANSKLKDVLCARMEKNGAVSIIAGKSHPRLAKWNDAIDLGDLFATGMLG